MHPIIDEVCRWDAPGGTGSLLLSASTVRDLRAKAIQAFLSLPRRGVETGGLLFGSQQDGQLFIQGFEPIPCEHRYGPSFTLSDDDRTRLKEILGRSGLPPVIGFYRSYTGRKAEIEEGELTLLRENFPQGPFVFLQLQPVNAQACTAGFRLCQDGELLAEPPYVAVPFDPDHWNADAPAAPKPPVLPPPYRARPMEASAPPPAASPQQRSPRRWWGPLLLCLIGGIGGIGGSALYELGALSRQPRWVELYLDAKPAADAQALAVTWDAAASKTIGATHALLGVNDGPVHRDIPLSEAQLQLGRYLYTPANPELELRLVLYGNGPALSGGTLRLAPAAPLAAAAPTPVNTVPPAPVKAEPAPATKAAGPRTPIHEVQPSIPAGIRARLNGNVEIPVTVKINVRGQVTGAFAPPVADGLKAYLSHEAVRAAYQWRFVSGGSPSEKTISFTFTP